MEKLGIPEVQKHWKTLTQLATKPEDFAKVTYETDAIKEQFSNVSTVLTNPTQTMKMYRQSMDEILGKETLFKGGVVGKDGEIQKTPDV